MMQVDLAERPMHRSLDRDSTTRVDTYTPIRA